MVKIIHFHAETKNNRGDKAIVMAVKDLLIKNMNITSYSSIKLIKLKKKDCPAILNLILKKNNLLKELLDKKIIYKIYKIYKIKVNKQLIKKINKQDLVVIGGGGIYSNYFFPLDEKIIDKIKIPIILFSPGININLGNPELSEEIKESILNLNKKSLLSSVRDPESMKFLKKMGIDSEYIGDPAIFLTNKLLKPSKNNKKLKIGINIANHGWKLQKELIEKVIQGYISALKRLNSDRPFELYYLKHHKNEKIIIKKLKKEFPKIKTCDYQPKKLKSSYNQLDLVVSMMLHSTIFAFSNNIPIINIAYDKKNIAFMNSIKQGNKVIKVTDLNGSNLYNLINKSLKEKINKNNRIKEIWDKRTKEFIKKIKAISPYP